LASKSEVIGSDKTCCWVAVVVQAGDKNRPTTASTAVALDRSVIFWWGVFII
jgi:hypothetical protein